MGIPTVARVACVLGAGAFSLVAWTGCEALLDAGAISERPVEGGGGQGGGGQSGGGQGGGEQSVGGQADGSAQDETGPAEGAFNPVEGGARGGETSQTASEAGPAEVDETGTTDATQPYEDAATGDATAEDAAPTASEASLLDDAAEAGPAADARQPDGAPGSDAGPPPADAEAPPKGCAAGAKVLSLKLSTSAPFGTLGAVCVTYAGSVGGWNASNAKGRSVTAVGSKTVTLTTIPEGTNQQALGPGADGFIYWNFSAGTYTYAAMYAYP